MKVKVEDVVVPEERARSRFTDEQQAFLKASLTKYGQLSQPIVRPLQDGRYELIDGESRLNAAKEAGVSELDVLVVDLANKDASLVNLLMNVARGTQDPMGTASALKKAQDADMTLEEIAAATGHRVAWVKFTLSLLELPPVYQDALREDKLKVTHIAEATRLPSPKEMDAALGAALKLGWKTGVMHVYVENRLAEYQLAEEMKESTGVAAPPPPPEPQRLISYGQCLVCGQMVDRKELNLPSVCSDCYTMSKYVVSQCGTGDEGMQRVYKALELQQAFQQQQRQFFLQQQMGRQPMQPPSPPGVGPGPTPETETLHIKPSDVTAEEWGRLKALKKQRRPG